MRVRSIAAGRSVLIFILLWASATLLVFLQLDSKMASEHLGPRWYLRNGKIGQKRALGGSTRAFLQEKIYAMNAEVKDNHSDLDNGAANRSGKKEEAELAKELSEMRLQKEPRVGNSSAENPNHARNLSKTVPR